MEKNLVYYQSPTAMNGKGGQTNNLCLLEIILKQNRRSEVIITSRKRQMLKQQDALQTSTG